MEINDLESIKKKIQQDHPDPKEYDFANLEIEVQLASQMILTIPWINFDGLISHFFLLELLQDDYYLLPPKSPIDFFNILNIPIKKNEHMGLYFSSVSHLEKKINKTTMIYKRFPSLYLDFLDPKRTKRIQTNRATFKDYAIKFVYFIPQKITFWCKGDYSWIKKLLNHLEYLGKKSGAGFGEIASKKIREIEEDYSLIKNGKLTRPIPMKYLESFTMIMRAPYKPPYWSRKDLEMCGMPFSKAKIKNEYLE